MPAHALQDNHWDQPPAGSAAFETVDITTGYAAPSSHRQVSQHGRVSVGVNTDTGDVITALDRFTGIWVAHLTDRSAA